MRPPSAMMSTRCCVKKKILQFRGYIVGRRQVCLNIIQHAIDRGELSQDVNAELFADLIYGPYWYRLLIGHAPLSETFAKELVKSIVTAALFMPPSTSPN